MANRWTEAELAAVESTHSYPAFAALTGYSKSYDAWEVKRRRLALAEPTVEANKAALLDQLRWALETLDRLIKAL